MSLTIAVRALALSVAAGAAQHFAPAQVESVITWLSESTLGTGLMLALLEEHLRRTGRKNDPQA